MSQVADLDVCVLDCSVHVYLYPSCKNCSDSLSRDDGVEPGPEGVAEALDPAGGGWGEEAWQDRGKGGEVGDEGRGGEGGEPSE